MPIETLCPSCGRKLKAPDEATGRRARCPQCGTLVEVPDVILDAEEVEDDTYALAAMPVARSVRPVSDEPLDDADDGDRRPCPVCGEMIKTRAAKCRYCGEIFEPELRRRVGRRRGAVDPETLPRFRREMHGLGGFWFFMACLMLLAAIVLRNVNVRGEFGRQDLEGVALIVLFIAVLYVIVGVFVFLKHMWAVWVGLVLAYLSAAIIVLATLTGNGGCANAFFIALLAAVIVQSHRVIKWAGELNAAGIALTAKPQDRRETHVW